MYKDVDPGTIFDEIVGASGTSADGTTTPDPDAAKAKADYQDFLTLWKDADPDIPIFQQAKSEYAKLQ